MHILADKNKPKTTRDTELFYFAMLLHRAVECNALDDLKDLIKSNDDLNIKYEEGNTLLHIAALHNSLDVFIYLIDFCKMDLTIFNKHNELPQDFAAKGNALEVIKYLKSINIDLAAQNVEGKTLLHTASLHNSMKIVKYLAEDCNINITSDDNGNFPQHCAAEGNALEAVKYLKTINADLTVQNNDGNTLLHIACLKNAIDVLKFLIEDCKIDLNKNKKGSLPQHYAARGNALHSIKYLNQIKIDFTVTTNIGNTLLHVACLNNSFDVLKYLIEDCKMDMSISNLNGQFPQHFAAHANALEMMKYLKTQNIDLTSHDNDGNSLVHIACASKALDVLKFLIEDCKMDLSIINKNGHFAEKISPQVIIYLKTQNIDFTVEDKYGNTLVHIACLENNFDLLKFLIEDYKMDLSIRNENGRFPQHFAAMGNALEVMKYLKTRNVDFTVQDNLGNTLLHIACKFKALDVLKFLIEDCKLHLGISNKKGRYPQHFAALADAIKLIKYLKSLNIDLTVQDNNGDTLLHIACLKNHLDFIKFLIEECKMDLSITNKAGYSVQHFAAHGNALDVMKYLKTQNVDFTVQDNLGNTLLHIACKFKALDVLTFLMEDCGMDLSISNKNGCFAQHYAADANALEVMKYLKSQNINLSVQDNYGATLVHSACEYNALDVLKFLIEDCKMDFNIGNINGNVAQHYAAICNALEVMKYLKSQNIDLSVQDNNGYTLVHFACEFNALDVLKFLIEDCKMDFSIRNKRGRFAQHLGTLEIMKYLKTLNVDLTVQDNEENTLLHCACMRKDLDVLKFLIENCKLDLHITNIYGHFPQHYAAKNNALEIIKYLRTLNSDLTVQSLIGESLIHWACIGGALDVLKFLIEDCKFDLCVSNNYGLLAQHFAARFNALDVMKYLKKLNVDLTVRDNNGDTVVHFSCKQNCLDTLKFLLEDCEMDLSIRNKKGRFAQHYAAKGNALNVMTYLKTLNVDLYVCDNFEHTLLHDASMENSIDVFIYLIEECSMDLDVRTKDGCFPQHYAARFNAVDIIKYLKNKNFYLNVRDYNGNTLHHKAAMGNAVDVFKYLIEECDMGLNVYNKDGSFPQLEAAKYGSLDVIKYFKTLNSDFGIIDYNGNTMLHKACMTDSLDVVKYLLEECNMELGVRNSYGEYPQHHAAIGNALDVLKYFKEQNQDLNVRDSRGNTLLHKLSSSKTSLNVRKFLIEECNMSLEVSNNRGESRRPRKYTSWR